MHEDAAVGRLRDPAPFDMELIVLEGLLRDHVAERLAGDGDDAVFDAEHLRGGHVAVGGEMEGPSIQILSVEEFRFALSAGEAAEDAQDEEGGQISFHGVIAWVIFAKIRFFF
jgi:hypothetical protein